MALKYKIISKKTYDMMKKMGYINRGKDGIIRGIFFVKGKGTVSQPVKYKK